MARSKDMWSKKSKKKYNGKQNGSSNFIQILLDIEVLGPRNEQKDRRKNAKIGKKSSISQRLVSTGVWSEARLCPIPCDVELLLWV